MDTYSVQPTLTKIWGAHTARAGYDFRQQVWNITNEGYPGGRFSFNGAYTRLNNSAAQNDRAQSWAQFLLGLPTAATGAVANAGGQHQPVRHRRAGRVQPDVSRPVRAGRLAGQRPADGECRTAPRDQQRHARSREPQPGRLRLRHAEPDRGRRPGPPTRATRFPQIPVDDFRVTGGLLFADGAVNETVTKLLPRAAAAYMLDDKTVLRGGVGLFSYDYFFENINQAGFSQATPGAGHERQRPHVHRRQPVQPGAERTVDCSRSGRPTAWPASSDRTSARCIHPSAKRRTTRAGRWRLQHDFGGGWVAGFTYLGSRGTNLPVVQQVNNVPHRVPLDVALA